MGKTSSEEDQWNSGVVHTRNLILRGICAVYLCAFLSFYYQSPGLFGKNGILPADLLFSSTTNGAISDIHRNPTLLHFSPYLGLDVTYMMDILALSGITISFTCFISQTFCILPTFTALWSLYYSLMQVTQSFSNQSDLLLLEAGFLCLLLAPIINPKKSCVSDRIIITLFKWLLFRFMFDSGAVKFFSGCPKWRTFSGLAYHFETLPLPTTFSWYCYHLPKNFMKVSNIFTNLSELVCPWFFFFPIRNIRIGLFYWEVYLQLCIIVSGNYGFLNFLMIVLLISLLDDKYLKSRSLFRIITNTFWACFILTLLISVATLVFSQELDQLMFNQEYIPVLRSMIKISPLVPLVAITANFLANIWPSILREKAGRTLSYGVTLITFTLCSLALIAISMFSDNVFNNCVVDSHSISRFYVNKDKSVVPHSNLDSAMNITNTELGQYYQKLNKYHIINEYGHHLREMRTERFEVNLEYTEDINQGWNKLKFTYKPWSNSHRAPIAGPYLPRLDIKVYETTEGTYRDHLWLLSLSYRILQNEPTVLKLFGINEKLQPTPKYVRGTLNKFKYTTLTEMSRKLWETHLIKEYFPVFSVDNPILLVYLNTLQITAKIKPPQVKNISLKNTLDFIRQKSYLVEGHTLVFSILMAGLFIITV